VPGKCRRVGELPVRLDLLYCAGEQVADSTIDLEWPSQRGEKWTFREATSFVSMIRMSGVVRELDDESAALAYPAMKVLRPGLQGPADFVERVRRQRQYGYRLVGSCDADGSVVAVAGFWCAENLAFGRFVYVDDLSTLASARRQGHAGTLLRWVDAEARRLGCAHVHLDSATHRHDAHRLYLSSGYGIMAFHFLKPV
jgi:GNAT superfamily N-acetyltransferase